MGPKAVWTGAEYLAPTGIRPTVQHVASRYADHAILALVKMATLKTISPVKRKYLCLLSVHLSLLEACHTKVHTNFGRNFGEQYEQQTGTTGSVSTGVFNLFFHYVMGCV